MVYAMNGCDFGARPVIFSTLEKISPNLQVRASCFERPEFFRVPQNTTCCVRLNAKTFSVKRQSARDIDSRTAEEFPPSVCEVLKHGLPVGL